MAKVRTSYSHFCVDDDEFCVVANRGSHFSVCVTSVAHTFLIYGGKTMKKKMRSILSLALAVLMLMSVVPLSVNASEYAGECGAEGDNVTWEIDVNTGTLYINGTGDMADYEAEWSSAPWYEYREFPGFTYIVVGEGVTSVGDNAFRYTIVSKIALSSTVKKLGKCPFFANANIVIDENNAYLKMDDYGVIYSKDGKTLIYASKYVNYIYGYYTVPEGVEEFAPYAFCHFVTDSIPWLYIPSSVKSIPVKAFFSVIAKDSQPASIPYFFVNGNNPYYSSDEYGVLFDKNKEILYMTPHLHFDSNDIQLTNYIIPESVKELAEYSFFGYDDESILITENVTKIGAGAFYSPFPEAYGEKIYRLYIPKNVTSLADDFFIGEDWLSDYREIQKVVYYEGTQSEWESLYKGATEHLTVYYEHSHTNTIIEENCAQRTYICSGCNTANIIENIGEHSWYRYDEIKNCEEGGVNRFHCNDCSSNKMEYVPPAEHDWVWIGNVVAPCVGGTKGYYCTKCREEKEEHETPTEEHSYEWNNENDDIQCEGGYANLYCWMCSNDYYVYIEAEGHQYQFVSDNNATCTEDGTKRKECSRCNDIAETVVDVGSKLGHDLTEATVLSEQTCTQDGISVQVCRRCSEITATTESAYGHFDDDGDGKCDECKVVLEVIFPNVPSVPGTDVTPDAPGHTHSFTREVIFSSDCVTAGEQEFTCSCGEIYRAVIPASGHTDENADGVCDVCEERLGENVGDSEASGFLAKILEFFNKIAEFFRKLFNMA